MKKLIILSTALLLIAGIVGAQTTDSTHHRFGPNNNHRGFNGGQRFNAGHHNFNGKMGMMAHRGGRFGMMPGVHLSDAQRQQLKTINDSYHQQLASLQANDKLSLGDYKTQLAALHKGHQAQVTGIYTDEQKKQMADWKQNRQIDMQVRGDANLERMKLKLGLSDDQVAKLKAQRTQLQSQMKALRENTDLLPEQRMAQMKTLFTQQKDQFKSVLTPDQLSKMQSMHRGQMRPMGMHPMDNSQSK